MANDPHATLLEELGSYSCRPRAWVYWAFPWGEQGTELEKRTGPEPWQDEVLAHCEAQLLAGLLTESQIIAEAIQIAVRSGHDVGKSALVCWIVLWALSTREDTKGVVTANTEKQLRLKLWRELAKWHRLFIASSMFKMTATTICAADPAREKEWAIDAIPWSEDNPEAFAGLHNYGKRVLVVFDEASGIADVIWETIDGVMNEADTELLWFAFGNPIRNVGRFRDCFDQYGQGQFWRGFKVDSRNVSFTNKERIQRQIELWGEDSDYIKKRWLGEFPQSGSSQLIPADVIQLAMNRQATAHYFDPTIIGVDVARYGDNESVIVVRKGKDARSIPVWRGHTMATTTLADAVASAIAKHAPDAVFIDQGGVGGGVVDFLRRLGHSPIGVDFGSEAGIPTSGEIAYNKRAEMYLSLRTWLAEGGAIENSRDLYNQLVALEYGHSKRGKRPEAILLTPKEDMDESPDWADALALTFAFPVAARRWRGPTQIKVDYDPLASDRLPTQVELERMGGLN